MKAKATAYAHAPRAMAFAIRAIAKAPAVVAAESAGIRNVLKTASSS